MATSSWQLALLSLGRPAKQIGERSSGQPARDDEWPAKGIAAVARDEDHFRRGDTVAGQDLPCTLLMSDAVRRRLRVASIPGFGVGLQEENLVAGPQLVDVIELMNNADGDGVIDAE